VKHEVDIRKRERRLISLCLLENSEHLCQIHANRPVPIAGHTAAQVLSAFHRRAGALW
jgi:hypothetical protein